MITRSSSMTSLISLSSQVIEVKDWRPDFAESKYSGRSQHSVSVSLPLSPKPRKSIDASFSSGRNLSMKTSLETDSNLSFSKRLYKTKFLSMGERDLRKDLNTWPFIRRAMSDTDLSSLYQRQSFSKSCVSKRRSSNHLECSCSLADSEFLSPYFEDADLAGSSKEKSESICPEGGCKDDATSVLEENETNNKASVNPEQNKTSNNSFSSSQDLELKSSEKDDPPEEWTRTLSSEGKPLMCNSKGCKPIASDQDDLLQIGPSRDFEYSPKKTSTSDSLLGYQPLPSLPMTSKNPEISKTDNYYLFAISKDPGNPLLLHNYARFLHEVQKNLTKAEEFYERAILADPSEGEVLAQYAKLIWESKKDQERAASYFDRAIKASPDNCFVLAAYASFLWSIDSLDHPEEEKFSSDSPCRSDEFSDNKISKTTTHPVDPSQC